MKKFILGTILCASILAIAGCGNKDGDTPTTKAPTVETAVTESETTADVVAPVMELRPKSLTANPSDLRVHLIQKSEMSYATVYVFAVFSDTEQVLGDNPIWEDTDGDGKLLTSKMGYIKEVDKRVDFDRFPEAEAVTLNVFSISDRTKALEEGRVYWANGEPFTYDANEEDNRALLAQEGYYITDYKGYHAKDFVLVIGKESFRNDAPTRQRSFTISPQQGTPPYNYVCLNTEGEIIDFELLPGVTSAKDDRVTFDDKSVPVEVVDWKNWLFDVAKLDSVSWEVEGVTYTAPVREAYLIGADKSIELIP